MLPNLLIVGAGKCGTSSLHHYLGQHPEVSMSRPKETNFFVRDNRTELLDWYASCCDPAARVRGEASPSYTLYPVFTDVAARVHSLIPEAKLIYLVRDPLTRVVAQYVEMRAIDFDRRPFEKAVGEREESRNFYVAGSRYATQVEQYLRFFAQERILVLDQEQMRSDRAATLRKVFEFLGVDPSYRSPSFDEELNTRGQKVHTRALARWLRRPAAARFVGKVPPAVRAQLKRPLVTEIEQPQLEGELRDRLSAELAPEVERLRALTGLRFPSWSL
jgi:hypothetical protein